LLRIFSSLLLFFFLFVNPAYSARDTNSYDGNIFPIYAGNGSLVPPPSTLSESLKNERTSVLVFYLDDSSTSKQFAPVVSGIKLLWSSSVDLIPLSIDELDNDEFITVVKMDIKRLIGMIKAGKIIDSKTICAVMIYAAKKKLL